MMFSKQPQKSFIHLGKVCKDFCHQELSKVAQPGHTELTWAPSFNPCQFQVDFSLFARSTGRRQTGRRATRSEDRQRSKKQVFKVALRLSLNERTIKSSINYLLERTANFGRNILNCRILPKLPICQSAKVCSKIYKFMEICLTKLLVFSGHFYYLFLLKVFIVYYKSRILIFFKKLRKGGTQLRVKHSNHCTAITRTTTTLTSCFILFQMVVLQKY